MSSKLYLLAFAVLSYSVSSTTAVSCSGNKDWKIPVSDMTSVANNIHNLRIKDPIYVPSADVIFFTEELAQYCFISQNGLVGDYVSLSDAASNINAIVNKCCKGASSCAAGTIGISTTGNDVLLKIVPWDVACSA